MKLNYRRPLPVVLAFLSICSFWQLYDSIVPLMLANTFRIGETATGRIMAVENVLALFMLPFFGHLSDRTHTALGKRMPYILSGTAASVAAMPPLPVFDHTADLPAFAISLGVVLLAMTTYRSPAVALFRHSSSHKEVIHGICNRNDNTYYYAPVVRLRRCLDDHAEPAAPV